MEESPEKCREENARLQRDLEVSHAKSFIDGVSFAVLLGGADSRERKIHHSRRES